MMSPEFMNAMPTVSIVIPLYNHEHYIREALESVFNQTFSPCEVIVVDDGSTDASLSVVAGIAAADPRVIYWSQENQDAPQTINNGIRRARGDIVAVLNSDDIYHPERLATCVRVLSDEPHVSAVFTGLTFIDSDGNPVACEGFEKLIDFYRESNDLALSLFHGNFFVTTSNLVVRRCVFDEIGYFSRLRYAHDLDFYVRMIRGGKEIRFLETPLLRYRIHGTNTIRENRARAFVEVSAIAAAHAFEDLSAAETGSVTWRKLDRLFDICDGHGISRCMLIFLCHLQVLSDRPRDGSFFLNDRDFANYMDDRARRDITGKTADDEMRHELQVSKNRIMEKEHALSVAENRIAAMESSLSWQITRPLRWFSAMLRGRTSRRSP